MWLRAHVFGMQRLPHWCTHLPTPNPPVSDRLLEALDATHSWYMGVGVFMVLQLLEAHGRVPITLEEGARVHSALLIQHRQVAQLGNHGTSR